MGLSAGLMATRFGDPEIFLDGRASVARGDDQWDFSLLTGAEAGVSYRLSDAFEIVAAFRGETSATQESLILSLEFSWLRW